MKINIENYKNIGLLDYYKWYFNSVGLWPLKM